MIINSLRMRNICNHRDQLFEFDPRLNVVIGPNGSGKSTILDTMLWLLTGINRFHGKMEENISQLAEMDEPAFAEITFQHEGSNFRVRRDLREESMMLYIDDARPIRGVKSALAQLMSRLGTTPQWLSDHVFVAQGEIAGWFKKPPSDRSNEMAALMGVGNATKAHDAIGKLLGKIMIPTTTADLQTLMMRATITRNQLQEAEAVLAQYADVPQDIGAYLQARADIKARYYEAQKAGAEIQRLQEMQVSLSAQLNSMLLQEAELKLEADSYAELINTLEEPYREALVAIGQWERRQEVLRSRTLYETCFAELIQQFRTRPARMRRPSQYHEVDSDFHRSIQAYREQMAAIDSDIKRLSLLRPGEACPTCGNPADNCSDRLVALRSQQDALRPTMQEKLDIWKSCEDYRTRASFRQDAVESLRHTIRRLRTMRDSIPEVPVPTMPREQCDDYVDKYTVTTKAIVVVQNQRNTLQANINGVKQRLADIAQSLTAQEAVLASRPTSEMLTQAEAESKQMQDRYSQKMQTEMRIADLRTKLITTEEQIADIDRVMEERRRVNYAIEKMQAAREILHHSSAPRMLTFTHLEQMQAEIDSELSLFNAPFRVKPDDNLTFWAEFLDGKRRQPDRRLSPGQRIILSLALRIAMNATFASAINVLALDEPTAGLDIRKLSCVPQAFARLRELSHHKGLQVFLVTHEERLIDTFDRVIELTDD